MSIEFLGLNDLLLQALHEDIGTCDITTECCVPSDAVSHGFFLAKERGVICGIDILSRVFSLLDTRIKVTPLLQDGDIAVTGDIIAEIDGPSRGILTGERTALNFFAHMCGIATRTAASVRSVSGTKVRIVDTRKTTPGLRVLEKYAVKCGGGSNHRFNLSDGILIKDNHILAAGGIAKAVQAARAQGPQTLKIEVETESIAQVEEALEAGADIIMLDNMTPELMAEAVAIIDGRALTEASGNMGDRNLQAVADTGVDFISVGALTHTVRALDISLKFKT